MYAEIRVLDELGFAPFSALDAVVGFDMAVDCVTCKLRGRYDRYLVAHTFADFEANVVPICMAVSKNVDIQNCSSTTYQWCLQVGEERALWECCKSK